MGGVLEVLDGERRERRWLAYHIAFLPNVKRPPKLREFVGGSLVPPRQKTPEELQGIARQWHAALSSKPK